MAANNGVLSWDLSNLSKALSLKDKDVIEYFTDGRRVSFLLERRLAYEVLRGSLAPSEGAGYDLLDKEGRRWEVRSITRQGIYFCPSFMVGSGRKFDEGGFLKKLDDIEGYIVSDIELFPEIPFWLIKRSVIYDWYRDNQLGSATKVSRQRILQLLKTIR